MAIPTATILASIMLKVTSRLVGSKRSKMLRPMTARPDQRMVKLVLRVTLSSANSSWQRSTSSGTAYKEDRRR